MANYGSWQGVIDLFMGAAPNAYWTEAVVTARTLPIIRDIINSELGPYYYLPFDDVTVHADVPGIINNIANDVCKTYIQTATAFDKMPRKSGTFEYLVNLTREQLKRIKLASGKDMQELVYADGSIVPRRTSTPADPKMTPTETIAQNWDIITDDGVDNNVYYDEDD